MSNTKNSFNTTFNMAAVQALEEALSRIASAAADLDDASAIIRAAVQCAAQNPDVLDGLSANQADLNAASTESAWRRSLTKRTMQSAHIPLPQRCANRRNSAQRCGASMTDCAQRLLCCGNAAYHPSLRSTMAQRTPKSTMIIFR